MYSSYVKYYLGQNKCLKKLSFRKKTKFYVVLLLQFTQILNFCLYLDIKFQLIFEKKSYFLLGNSNKMIVMKFYSSGICLFTISHK